MSVSAATAAPIGLAHAVHRAVAMVLCLGALVACREPASQANGGAGGARRSEVVARFGELEITAADVDARILALPADERPKPGQDLDVWYEEQIRQVAVEHRLRTEAAAEKLDEDPTFVAARRDAEKRLTVQLCLAERRPDVDEVTEEALRAAYEARAASLSAPERRAVYHIFLRRDGKPAAGVRQAIEALRDRVLGGESFQRLAAASSESETRHREGSLGWVKRGELPAGFEEVIFSLDEGVPSEPVATREGFHLFYVDQILPPHQLTFDEARSALTTRLVTERRDAALVELAAEAEIPPGSVVVDHDHFVALARAGDGDAVLARIGDGELTLGGLRQQVRQLLARQSADQRPPPTLELAWQVLEGFRRRELIARHCRAKGIVPAAELARRLGDWEQQALLRVERHRRLLALAEGDEARLKLFYDSNIGLFSKPPTWHLRRLRLPLGEDAATVMARLEDAARSSASLDEVAGELGGEIDDLGVKSLAEVGAAEPKLPSLLAPLAAGDLAAPYRTETTLEMIEVVDRQEAEPLPFAEVRAQVAETYVRQYTSEVYRRLSDQVLGTAELEILPAGLAALRQAASPEPDVSVAELEELLNEL